MQVCGRLGSTGAKAIFLAVVILVVAGLVQMALADGRRATGDDSVMIDPSTVSISAPAPVGPSSPDDSSHRPGAMVRPNASYAPPTTQPALTGPPPVIEVGELEKDFGKVWAGEPLKHTFTMKNVGEGVLIISGVHSSCGCTVPGDWDKQVEPGGTWRLPVTMRTVGYEGKVRRTVTVTTNDPTRRQVIFIIGADIHSRFKMTPPGGVYFGSITADGAVKRSVTIDCAAETPIVLKDPVVSAKVFTVELAEIEKGKKYELHVATLPPLGAALNQAEITITTDCKEQPTLTFPVTAYVKPRVEITRPIVEVPTPVATDYKTPVGLRNTGTTSVSITNIESSDPVIATNVEAQQPGRDYRVWITIPKGTEIPPAGDTLTIFTDDKEFPKFSVRIVAAKLRVPIAPMGRTGTSAAPGQPVAPSAADMPSAPPVSTK